jgi:hypothetical protein
MISRPAGRLRLDTAKAEFEEIQPIDSGEIGAKSFNTSYGSE